MSYLRDIQVEVSKGPRAGRGLGGEKLMEGEGNKGRRGRRMES